MKDLTIIIPLKEYDEKVDKLLNRAIESCLDNNIILVGNGSDEFMKNNSDKKHLKNVSVLNKSQDSSYQNNVNIAVESVKTKYFSVLEYDDVFSKIWFDNVEKYVKYDTSDTFAFLPLTEIVEYNEDVNAEKRAIGYSNEAVWASSFSENIGYFDLASLKDYLNFNTSGGIFNTNEFIKLGGLKNSMKLVFWLEFLKRALYNNKLIFVIPKVGYYHFVNREGSMSDVYAKTMSEKEADWWIDLSEKEYFFKKDRNKIYEE